MGQDNRHKRSSVPDSMPPELDSIDSSWDDDLPLDESAEIPVAEPVLELDRPTAEPLVPSEQYAARLMEEADALDPPEEQAGAHGRVPDLAFDEPDYDPDPGVRPVEDEDARLALLPDEPPPGIADVPERDAGTDQAKPAEDNADFSLNELGTLELASIPPLLEGAAATPEPDTHLKRAPSRQFDDLSLDLSAPAAGQAGWRATPNPSSPDGDSSAASDEADPAFSDMKDRYAMGDFTGALVIAESLLESDPDNPEAQRYVESCREVLTQMYAARLGQLDQRIVMAIPPEQIRWLSLDHRAGFLLSLIDGSSSIEEVLDVSGMTRLEAYRILYNLLEQRVIALEPA